ncbi:MAG: hypothetical protein HOP02_15310 [Methylococcaceae bacterium]|nr:hypothetical protein [Methylococcaceae bacterium]
MPDLETLNRREKYYNADPSMVIEYSDEPAGMPESRAKDGNIVEHKRLIYALCCTID